MPAALVLLAWLLVTALSLSVRILGKMEEKVLTMPAPKLKGVAVWLLVTTQFLRVRVPPWLKIPAPALPASALRPSAMVRSEMVTVARVTSMTRDEKLPLIL